MFPQLQWRQTLNPGSVWARLSGAGEEQHLQEHREVGGEWGESEPRTHREAQSSAWGSLWQLPGLLWCLQKVQTGRKTFLESQCTIFLQVDAEGPLKRLKNLLLNKKRLLSMKQWVTVGSNKCPHHPDHLFTLTDLLVRSLFYAHWIRHRDVFLYQVFRCPHALKVISALLHFNAFLFFISATRTCPRIKTSEKQLGNCQRISTSDKPWGNCRRKNTSERPWGNQLTRSDIKWVVFIYFI